MLGTLTVLEAVAACGAHSFVNISTDKAADPVCVLGYSKRIAERLTAHLASQTGGSYLSVRFGNVLGSRGSVLTSLSAQVAAGGPVTVTHPEVSRYFMTADEAVQLVLQAAVIGSGGEVLVLDMGEQVRIADMARRLVSTASRDIDIVYTGLRPGEKLSEDLLGRDELDERPHHPLIRHVAVDPLAPHRTAAVASAAALAGQPPARADSDPAAVPPAAAAPALQAGHPQDQQDDHRADDGPDDSRGVEAVDFQGVVFHQALQEAAHEGPHDAQRNGGQDADVVPARHQQPGDEADDQPDDDENNNEFQHAGVATAVFHDHATA